MFGINTFSFDVVRSDGKSTAQSCHRVMQSVTEVPPEVQEFADSFCRVP